MLASLPYAAIYAAMTFALVMSITPGPNNTMLLASGVNFGFRRTLPHMLGITCGCAVMMIAIALGLGQVFTRLPVLYSAMEAVSVAYLLYLAWRIAMSRALSVSSAKERPMTFLQAAAFQWVNPKAWMMAVTGVTAFRLDDNLLINALWRPCRAPPRCSRSSICRVSPFGLPSAWRSGDCCRARLPCVPSIG